MFSQDYEELFGILNAYRIKYLVVGAHAVIFHTQPRLTKDIDVWIPSELNDSRRVFSALKAFGAPLKDLTAEHFTDPTMIFQIGVAPVRIDIMVGLPGVSAAAAWKHRKKSRYGKASIHVLGLEEVIKAKRTAGRPQDQLDLAKLTARPTRARNKRE